MNAGGGILTAEQQTAAEDVVLQAHDALARWAARDIRPDAGDGVPPLDALTGVDGEALASALVLAAASLGAAEARHQNTAALRGALDLLLTETVARLTGGGGPGA